MSYRYKVIADNPLGYWDLSNINSGSNYDITSASNHAFVSNNVIFSTPPLILNSSSTAKFSFPTASIRINNTYDTFNLNAQNKTFSMEFWLSFNVIGNGNGYSINNTASSYYNNNQLDILKAINLNTGSTISKIFYDYNSNTIRFSFSGSSNNDSYVYVKDFDSPIHLVATYQGGKTNVILNGIPGSESFVYDKSVMQSASTASIVQFVIDGSSLNSNYSGSSSFLISNLAFYNYQLDLNVIKNHITWANYQDNPNYYSNLNQNFDYFNLINTQENYALYKKYSGTGLKNYKYQYKIAVDDLGVGPARISPMVFANYSLNNYSFNSSSGVVWSASSDYLYFSDFGSYISNKFSIMMRISSSVTASNQYLFSITNVNGKDTLFLQKNPPTSSGYYLYYFDEVNKIPTLFASIVNPTSTASGGENVILSYDGSNVYLYASTSSVTSTSSALSLRFGNDSILAIGKNLANNSASTSSSNTTFYSNFSVFDFQVTNYSSAQGLIGTNQMIFAPLKNSLTINQYSYVIYEIQTSTITEPVAGSYINWDAPDNLISTISYDGGNTWASITWDSYWSNYNNNVYLENVLVKFEFNQKYNDIQPLRLTAFEYGIYGIYPMVSDFRNYSLYPSTSSAYNTHSFRQYDNKIVFRPENFGINFKPDSNNKVLGFANIISPSISTYGIDFWLRIDDLQTSKSSSQVYLLNTSSYSLYYTASNSVLQWASATNLLLNPSFENYSTSGIDNFYVINSACFTSAYGTLTAPISTNETSPAFGNYVAKVISSSITGTAYGLSYWIIPPTATGGRITVSPNTYYTFSAYVKNGTAIDNVNVGIEWYSSSNTSIATTAISTNYSTAVALSPSWQRISVTAQSPGTAIAAVPVIYTNANSTASGKYFYIDAGQLELGQSMTQYNDSSLFFVYINGASVVNKSFLLKQNEYYHIGISNTYPLSGSISINGGVSNTGSVNANATYGHISVWNTTPSQSDIQNRYNLFVLNVIQTASIQDNTLFLRSSGYYDSASAYKTGTLML
jgi:hypothetical protein